MLRRLLYASRSKLPSRHANSVQVAHMICALAPLVETMDIYLAGGLNRLLSLWMGRTFAHYGLSKPDNARVHFLADRRRRPFASAAIQALPRRADVLITRSAPLALAWAERGRPVLFESHVPTHDAGLVELPGFVSALHTAPGSGVIAISEAVGEVYRRAGLSEHKILVAHDGVDLSAFTRPEHHESRQGALARLFGSHVHDHPVLLYTGSLRPEKGAFFLTHAAASLPHIHVAIVGGSPDECATLRAAAGPGVFIHPSVPHRDIPALLHDADILVMPYLNTGDLIPFMSPLKLFEYLAAGTPLLAADVPALQSILEAGRNCLIFAPGSTDSLRQATDDLLTMSVPDRHALRVHQLETAARHSWSQRAKTILEWHAALVRRSSR